jgi:hypothetical protein
LEFIRAKINSVQIRNNHVAISLLATVNGFFVEMSNPAKNDCDIPIYNMGSIFTIKNLHLSFKYNEKQVIFGILIPEPEMKS